MSLSVLPREYSNKCVIRLQPTIFSVSTNRKPADVGLYRNSVNNSWHHYLRDENCRNTKAAETCSSIRRFRIRITYSNKSALFQSTRSSSGNSNKSARFQSTRFLGISFILPWNNHHQTQIFLFLCFLNSLPVWQFSFQSKIENKNNVGRFPVIYYQKNNFLRIPYSLGT